MPHTYIRRITALAGAAAMTLSLSVLFPPPANAEFFTIVDVFEKYYPEGTVRPARVGDTGKVGLLFQVIPIPSAANVVVTVTGGLTLSTGVPRFESSSVETALALSVTANSTGTSTITLQIISASFPPRVQTRTLTYVVSPVSTVVTTTRAPVTPTTAAPITTAAPTVAPPVVVPATVAPPVVLPANPSVVVAAPAPNPVPNPAPVNPGNQAPISSGLSMIARKNTAIAIVLKGTDPNLTPLTYTIQDFPENGKLSGRAPNMRYTPDKSFVGTDAFTYFVSNGKDTSTVATVQITVISTKTLAQPVRRKVIKK